MPANYNSLYNPFRRYAAQRYCRTLDMVVEEEHCHDENWAVPELYSAEVKLQQSRWKIEAELSSGQRYRLYDEGDMRLWRGSAARKDVIGNIAGRIGERLSFLLLKGFLNECIRHSREAGYSATAGWVVQERRKKDGKPFHKHVVQWNYNYLLKFDRRTTFVLLKKAPRGKRLLYVEEKESIQKSEIDGLAYLTLRKDKSDEGRHYLVIAEVKTSGRQSSIPNYLRSGSGRKEDIGERLFSPLRSLFPRHRLVYVITGYEHSLFAENLSFTGDQRHAGERISAGEHMPAGRQVLTGEFPFRGRNDTFTGHSSTERYNPDQERGRILRSGGPRIVEKLLSLGVQPLFLPLPSNVKINSLAEFFYRQLLEYNSGG